MEPDKKKLFLRVIRRHKELLLLILMFTVAFMAYANTLHNPFVLDDLIAITKNKNIRMTSFNLWELPGASRHNLYSTRPLAMMSFALNYAVHQYEPLGYHLVNILIHLFSGIFLYFFIKTTFIAISKQSNGSTEEQSFEFSPAAYAASFLWLVNPVQTQAVNYVVQRMNSMAAMFFILSLLLYAKSRLTENRNRKRQLFAACLFAGVLSVGSKENAAILPAFLFLYEWYFFKDLSVKWFKRRAVFLAGIFLFICLLGFLFLKGQPIEKIAAKYAVKDFTLSQRLLTETRVVIYYFSLILFPHPSRLNLDYDFPLSLSIVNPVSTLFSIITIGAMICLAISIAGKHRFLSFCILWYFGTLLIESSIIPIDIIYEHRIYLPSMLVIPAIVMVVHQRLGPNRAAIPVFAVLVAVWFFWIMERNIVWQDKMVLWADAAGKSPNKARPHINLADLLISRGYAGEAVKHSEIALRIDPDSAAAHINMGGALFRLGRIDESIYHFKRVLELTPNDHQAHNNLGLALVCKGKLEEAVVHFQNSVRIKPDFTKARRHLNKALNLYKTIYGAAHDFSAVLQALDVTEASLPEKMDRLHSAKLRLEKGLKAYQTAISRLRKGMGVDMVQLEDIERIKKDYEDHLDLFRQIVRDRNVLSAHYDIACILSRKNRIDEALNSWRFALESGFAYPGLLQADADLKRIADADAVKGR